MTLQGITPGEMWLIFLMWCLFADRALGLFFVFWLAWMLGA